MSSSSSSLSSSCHDDKSKGSAQSAKMSRCSDSNPSRRTVSAGSQSRKSRQPKKSGVPNKKKGKHSFKILQWTCCRFHCLLLCLAGYVGFGAVPRTPHPSKRQSRSATTSRENRTPKNGNSKKLASQELEIKHLNNLIFELQKENDSLKTENRTLKQASPPSIAVVFKISSSSLFALSSVYCVN